MIPRSPRLVNTQYESRGERLVGIAQGSKLLITLVICFGLGTSFLQTDKAQGASLKVARVENREAMIKPMAVDDVKPPASFYEVLRKALKKRKTAVERICPPTDSVARRVLEEYGAIFLANKKVKTPPVCIFTSESQVEKFQDEIDYVTETIAGADIELQTAAMDALLKAREDAQKEGLDITPRDGAEAARRSYEDSLHLWNTRFLPALEYWLIEGKLTEEQVTRLKELPLHDQIAEVLELEKTGIYFSKDLSKSILYSIAAPGTSQHIAMLAFDVNEFDDPRVREILAKHGWFQTVLSDLPHFTYLGLKEKDLPKNGLKNVEADGQTFWIPNVVSQP
jgi:hypothetical protein